MQRVLAFFKCVITVSGITGFGKRPKGHEENALLLTITFSQDSPAQHYLKSQIRKLNNPEHNQITKKIQKLSYFFRKMYTRESMI